MQCVWNITDDPSTSIKPQRLMVFQQMVKPGKCIYVPDELMETPTKLMADQEAGLLYLGVTPPAAYLKAKSSNRATVDRAAKKAQPAPSVEKKAFQKKASKPSSQATSSSKKVAEPAKKAEEPAKKNDGDSAKA